MFSSISALFCPCCCTIPCYLKVVLGNSRSLLNTGNRTPRSCCILSGGSLLRYRYCLRGAGEHSRGEPFLVCNDLCILLQPLPSQDEISRLSRQSLLWQVFTEYLPSTRHWVCNLTLSVDRELWNGRCGVIFWTLGSGRFWMLRRKVFQVIGLGRRLSLQCLVLMYETGPCLPGWGRPVHSPHHGDASE